MFIELVDALRCPNTHEESWLVVAATVLDARHVREGTLGCPVCAAEYPVREGIADFRGVADRISCDTVSPTSAAPLAPAGHLAAMLDLADALGFAVLVGRWSSSADALLALDDCPPLLLVDPPPHVTMRPGLSGLRSGGTLPLATGSVRAIAVDRADVGVLDSAARVTRVGGRLVAPADAPLPVGVRELARDASLWVAAREAGPSGLVTLHVRRGGGQPPAV